MSGAKTAAEAETQLDISIDANDTMGIDPTPDGAGTAVDLEADVFGTVGNVLITSTGANITITSMSASLTSA